MSKTNFLFLEFTMIHLTVVLHKAFLMFTQKIWQKLKDMSQFWQFYNSMKLVCQTQCWCELVNYFSVLLLLILKRVGLDEAGFSRKWRCSVMIINDFLFFINCLTVSRKKKTKRPRNCTRCSNEISYPTNILVGYL